MSQTALNLVAILVFSITLSSLLGPILHLSPVVPAIATVGLLGFATFDSFSWQGRGVSLLIDWFASASPQHRERVVRHEAGHFLVAHQLRIPITGYTLSAWETLRQGQPGLGGVRFDSQEIEAEVQRGALSAQMLDRYCAVWMAGIEAETLIYGSAEGGANDRQQLRAVLAQLRLPESEIQQKERWSALQARTLLQESWSAYEALVTAMQQRTPVPECSNIIQSSQG